MDSTRPGYKTTEFWVTLIAQICGILTLTGVIRPEDANSYIQGGGQLVGGLMTVIAQVSYAVARGKTKRAMAKAAARETESIMGSPTK